MQIITRTEPTHEAAAEQGALAPPRKAYERPQIVYRASLEAMASACDPETLPGGKGFNDQTCSPQFS